MSWRDWFKGQSHKSTSSTARRQARRAAVLRLEELENRIAPAGNLAITNAFLVNRAFNPISAPYKGEMVFVEANWTTQGVESGASYRIDFTVDGVTLASSTLTAGAGGAGTQSWRWIRWGWYASPGGHTVSVTVDGGGSVSETNESDNTRNFNFTPVTAPDLPQKFVAPVGGTPFDTWGITNYNDVNPLGTAFADFNGNNYAYDGHDAYDIAPGGPGFGIMDDGLPILAAADGTVVEVVDGFFDRNTAFGTDDVNYVKIAHGNGWDTYYLHLRRNSIVVQVGQEVVAGQVLGLMGSSGHSTGNHLHFSVYHNDAVVETEYDPTTYWQAPLAYQGAVSSILETGVTTSLSQAIAALDVQERPVPANVFTQAAGQELTLWFALYSRTGDSLEVKFYKPDGTRDTRFTFTTNPGQSRGGHYRLRWFLPSNLELGTWKIGIEMNGVEMGQAPFQVAATGASAARVTQGSTYISNGRTTPIDFGSVALGGGAPQQTFTVNNLGTATLNLSNLVLPSGYSLVSSFPSSIVVGGSASFTVQMPTAVAGTKAGLLSFDTNNPNAPSYRFNITGAVIGGNPGRLHGQVFNDVNENDIQQAVEAGLFGWTVNLLNPSNNNVIATTTTTFNGYYEFLNLPAGNYRVRQVLTSGWHQTTNNPADVSVGSTDVLVSPFGVAVGDLVVESIARANSNPTNAATADFTVTFSEAVTGVNAADFALTTSGVSGATIASVSGSGSVYTVRVNTGSGSGTIRLDVVDDDSIIDGVGNNLGGIGTGNGNFTTGEVYAIDKAAPTVSSVVRVDASPTNASSVRYTVTFSEAVTGVNAADFTLTTSGVSGTSITGVTGSGTTYTVTVNTGSGSGTIRLDVLDDDSIVDTASNALAGGFTSGQVYAIDKEAPTVSSVVRLDASPTNAASVRYTVTFSEAVTGVNAADFTLTTSGVSGTSITSVSGSGTTYTVTVGTGSGSGTIRLDVLDDDSIVDAVSNALAGGFTSGQVYVIDRSAPTVSSVVRLDASPTNAASVRYTVTFSEAVTGVNTADFTLTTSGVSGTAITDVSGSGSTYTVTVGTGSGSGTVRLDVLDDDSIVDTANNPLANGFASGEVYVIDRTAPTVSSVVRADASPTNASSVRYTVTFSESVTGVNAADFTLTTSGVSGAAITDVSGTGSTYTVTVSTGSGSGTIRLDVLDDDSIIDAVSNALAGGFTSGQVYALDRNAPTISSVVRADANPTNAASVRYTVTFSEAVTGVNAADFTLTTSGVSGTAITDVSGSGTAYTVTVNTGSGSGTIRLDVLDDDSIVDTASNPLAGGFTAGEVYTIDKAAPTVSSVVRLDASPTNAPSVRYTVTFSEAVTGVNAADFTLTTSGLSGTSITDVSGSGTTYTVTVGTGSGSGTIRLDVLDDDSIIDGASNTLGGGFTSGQVYALDRNALNVVSVVRADANPTNAASVRYTVTFSEAVTGVNAADFTLTTSGVSGAAISGVSGSGSTYTVTVSTGSGSGTLRLDVLDDDSIVTGVGNPLANGFTSGEVYAVDKTAPTVSSVVRLDTSPTNASSVRYTVTFSEAVTGVSTADFTLTTSGVSGTSITGVSGSGTTYTVTVGTGSGSGTIRLDVLDDDSIVDTANNPLTGGFTSGEVYAIDKTVPTVSSVVRVDASPTNAASVRYTVTFSEVVTGVNTADFTLTASGVSGASITGVSGSGTTYTVTVGTGSGSGTLRLDVLDDDSIVDTASNPLAGGFTAGEVYAIDRSAPTVSSVVRLDASPTNAASVRYTVTFSESVTGVNAADFTLTTSGVSGTSITSVSGSGTTYTVTVGTGSGSGTIRLDVLDDDSIVDTASNPLAGGFTAGEVYAIDKSAPTVSSVVRVDASPTNAASVRYTVTFSEGVTGVNTADFTLTTSGLSGAAITGVSGSGTTYIVTVGTGSGSGTLRLDVLDDDSIVDGVGNTLANGFNAGEVYAIDKAAPTVSSVVRLDASPTNAASVRYTVTFSEAVTGVNAADFTLTTSGVSGTSITGVSGSGTTYTVTVGTGSGSGTLRLDVLDDDSIVDTANNPLANGFTAGEVYAIDRTAPTVSSVVRLDASPTNASSVRYTVTFSEAVTGVNAADFTLTTSGLSGTAITDVSGSGTTYTVTVNTGSGNGTIRLDVLDDDSIIDGVGNTLANGFTSGQSYDINRIPLTVASVARVDASPTNAASVRYTVTFSTAVTGVNTADFTLTTSGVSGTSITSVSGSGTTYTVTVGTGSGNGTLRLDVLDDDSIVDGVGNTLANGFTAGEVYAIDRVAPTVSSIVRADANLSAAASVAFTVTFSEAVSGVNAGDFTLTTTGVVGAAIASVTGSNGSYTVTVNTGSEDGTIRLDLLDNDSIADAVGNQLGGAGAGNGDFTTGETYTLTANDAPSFTRGADQTVSEDAGAQVVNGWASAILAGPADEAGQTLTFLITGNTNLGLFAVAPTVSSTGTLTYTPASNVSGSAILTLILRDDGGTARGGEESSTAQSFTITVTEVNDAPVGGNDDLSSVAEDSAVRTIAFSTLLGNDNPAPANEGGQTLTITAVRNAEGGTVEIQGTNVLFTPAADFNGLASFTYTLQDDGTTNGNNDFRTATATVSFTVTEVNDAPTGANDSLAGVPDTSGPRTIPFSALLGNDSKGPANESGQSLTITAVSAAVGGTVEIQGNNVLFTPAVNFNGLASFTYTLRDNGTTNGSNDFLTATATVSFPITEVNDAPVGTPDPLASIAEDSGVRTIAFSALLANDHPGPADESGQTLTIVAVSTAVGGSVEIQSSNILFTPAAHFNGAASFTYTLQDNGTTNGTNDFRTATATVSFTITAVNDAPGAANDTLSSSAEDSGGRTIAFTTLLGNDSAGPAEESGQTLTISAVSNAVGGTVEIQGTNVLFTPAADFNGLASFTYTLQDNGTTNGSNDFLTATATVNFTVTSVNDQPSFTQGVAPVVNEDAGAQSVPGWASNLSVGPSDEAGQTLTFAVTGNTNPGLFAVAPAVNSGGTLTFTAAPNAHGSATITVVLQDNGGTADGGVNTSVPHTFLITVNPVNDAPSFTGNGDLFRAEDAGAQSIVGWAVNLSAGPANEASQALTFLVVSNSNPGLFAVAPTVSSDGTLTFTAAPNAHGSATITVVLQDNGGTANGGVNTTAPQGGTIFITPVNDAPVLDGSSPTLAPVPRNAVDPVGVLVSDFAVPASSDVDGPRQGIAVLAVGDLTAGTWQFSTDGGGSWHAFGALTPASARLLLPTDLVRFVPALDFVGDVQLSYRAWDQQTGIVGGAADLSAPGSVGGNSAFSSVVQTANLQVAMTLAPVKEDARKVKGTRVSALLSPAFVAQDPATARGIAVVGLTGGANGSWQFSTNGGKTYRPFGAVSATTALLLRARDRVRFVPAPNFHGTAALTFHGWNGVGTPGSTANLSAGAAGFRADAEVSLVVVTPVNDRPVLADGSPALTPVQNSNANPLGNTVASFAAALMTDLEGDPRGIAIVGATAGAAGSWQFSTNGGGSWQPLGTVSPTSGRLLRDTDLVRFVPAPGFVGEVKLKFKAWDGTEGAFGQLLSPTSKAFSTFTETAILQVTI